LKKKVSILITSLAGGGAERVVSILVNELQNSYDITLILMNNTVSYDLPKNIKVINLENSSSKENTVIKILKLPILAFKYKTLCEKLEIETSLSFMYRPNFINTIAKLFGLKSKVIISERNTPSKTYGGNTLASKTGQFLVKYLYPYSDLIIPNSNGNALDLIENFTIYQNKINVIENPFDIQMIDVLANSEISIKSINKFVFIMVGRFEKHKRHIEVIEAFSKLKYKNLQLWILGQGPEENNIRKLINKLNLIEEIKLIGFDKNPYKYMKKANCLILNSTREGFPNVLVEALACGIPVVSTDCFSGPREIISPLSNVSSKVKNKLEIGDYGLLMPVNQCKLKEAMELMIENKSLYKSFSGKARSRAKDFNKTKIIEKFQEVL